MWDDLVAQYAWADSDELDAYTFSVISGKTEDEVIRAFGGDVAGSRMMTFAGAADEQATHLDELLRVVTVEKHVIAIEWGYHGSIPEIARRASAARGEFFSVHRSINARYQVMHALDGRVDAMFDPFGLEDATSADRQLEVPAWAQDVPFRMETLCAESFALMERTMGVSVEPAWLDVSLRTSLLASPDTLFSDPKAAWLP
ncbi:DUF6461 domain-containing protein [Streptomyces sp. NPDC050529]|uniref:DUF6461 domain-containing protein n=1 Tax=Streptomyces sp. NPDC050529 TaxID=3365624 RepID=UPI0037A8925F